METAEICVLIIDDCEEDREVLRRYLKQSKDQAFHILEAESGIEGWNLCLFKNPDCILLDYHLPDMDGSEFLSQLKQHEKLKTVPVLIITGLASEAFVSQVCKLSGHSMLDKGALTKEGLGRAIGLMMQNGQPVPAPPHFCDPSAQSSQNFEKYAYTIAHDIQAAVRKITINVERCLQDSNNQITAHSQSYLDRALRSSHFIHQFVKEMLDYVVMEERREDSEAVSLQDVLDHVLEQLDMVPPYFKGTIIVGTLPIVIGKRLGFQQLFQNLLSNALKYHGEKLPEIEIAVQDHQSNWLFSVNDHGVGIPQESLGSVFRLFERVNPHAKTQGWGIGLALCKRIVETHGGQIWAESTAQQGTTFFFTLPKGNLPEDIASAVIRNLRVP